LEPGCCGNHDQSVHWFLGRGFIDNAAHLGDLVSGAALAVVVDYRRLVRVRRSLLFGVLRCSFGLVAISFLKVARTSAPQSPQVIHITSRDIFLNYVNVLNQAHETVAAVVLSV
jgi:hypothetical protein